MSGTKGHIYICIYVLFIYSGTLNLPGKVLYTQTKTDCQRVSTVPGAGRTETFNVCAEGCEIADYLDDFNKKSNGQILL